MRVTRSPPTLLYVDPLYVLHTTYPCLILAVPKHPTALSCHAMHRINSEPFTNYDHRAQEPASRCVCRGIRFLTAAKHPSWHRPYSDPESVLRAHLCTRMRRMFDPDILRREAALRAGVGHAATNGRAPQEEARQGTMEQGEVRPSPALEAEKEESEDE